MASYTYVQGRGFVEVGKPEDTKDVADWTPEAAAEAERFIYDLPEHNDTGADWRIAAAVTAVWLVIIILAILL